jgi:hypothetical protein
MIHYSSIFFFSFSVDETMKESVYERMTTAEKKVAIELRKIGIHWSYERPLFIWDEHRRPRVWTPDFYLTSFGIYVEVCGSEDFDYQYRKKIFHENGYKVIFLHLYKDTEAWKKHLLRFLWFFTNDRWDKLNILVRSRKRVY